MQVKVGDVVLFSKYGYDEVKIEGRILHSFGIRHSRHLELSAFIFH